MRVGRAAAILCATSVVLSLLYPLLWVYTSQVRLRASQHLSVSNIRRFAGTTPKHLPPPSCVDRRYSTRYIEECEYIMKQYQFPLLVTGFPGFDEDAALYLYRSLFSLHLHNNSRLPSDNGSVSWVFAFNDAENFPDLVRIPSKSVLPIPTHTHTHTTLYTQTWRVFTHSDTSL